MDAVTQVPAPVNETVLDYAPGSAERGQVQAALAELAGSTRDFPHVIGGGGGRRLWQAHPGAPTPRPCRDPRAPA